MENEPYKSLSAKLAQISEKTGQNFLEVAEARMDLKRASDIRLVQTSAAIAVGATAVGAGMAFQGVPGGYVAGASAAALAGLGACVFGVVRAMGDHWSRPGIEVIAETHDTTNQLSAVGSAAAGALMNRIREESQSLADKATANGTPEAEPQPVSEPKRPRPRPRM